MSEAESRYGTAKNAQKGRTAIGKRYSNMQVRMINMGNTSSWALATTRRCGVLLGSTQGLENAWGVQEATR